VPDGALAIAAGDGFWLAPPVAPFEAGRAAELWLCTRASGGDHCSVYSRGPDEGFGEDRCIHRRTFRWSSFTIDQTDSGCRA
jgi:hypothetical protein